VEAAAALVEPGSAVVDAGLLRFVSGDVEEVSATAVGGSLAGVIADVETRLLREALLAAGGNQSEAARVLGVSRVGLIKKMTRLGLR
jgi:DNA-binding protein Fis